MTPKQLEKKAKQLLYRRKLADTLEALEESIKTYMNLEQENEVVTRNFISGFDGNEVSVKVLPKVDPRQLKLEFEE